MHKERGTHWKYFVIFFIFCVTSTAFSEQPNTGLSVIKYTETIDLRDLSNNIKNLTTNIGQLTESQKQLTESVKKLTTSMNDLNVRIAVVEERTISLRTIQNIILVAIIGAIITPIVLYILFNRNRKDQQNSEPMPDQSTINDKSKDNKAFDLVFEKGVS